MPSVTDKTLVSWFCFDEETPKHCSVITVQAADKYDALAFGQNAPGKWSIASEDNGRTQTTEQLEQNPEQKIVLGQFIMMAAVFKDNSVTIYRDGEVYANRRSSVALCVQYAARLSRLRSLPAGARVRFVSNISHQQATRGYVVSIAHRHIKAKRDADDCETK